jgi:3,4-dihydroxy 2-butanone 4-phosphate synthase/GTP cyclohydrolase II
VDEPPTGKTDPTPARTQAAAVPAHPRLAEVAKVALATTSGVFEAHAFASVSGVVYLALVKGDLGGGRPVLARLHSECLTGDALGSVRCDCGVQLQAALQAITSEGRGVLIYATGHEGRGAGVVQKLKTYMSQDGGLDAVSAEHHLGAPADGRDYGDAAACLELLGVRTVRLLSNNPHKAAALLAAGIAVEEQLPLTTAPGLRVEAPDVTGLLGDAAARASRPYVALKYAQTLDGRIATRTGDSKWISGEPERRISHALRGACDAVLVGVGTAISDDPQLTVRLVSGSSPVRVILDSTLRLPADARILGDDAPTVVITTGRASRRRREALESRGAEVRVVADSGRGVDLAAALQVLRGAGLRSVLVEGGAQVITSFLSANAADRLIVSVAPTLIGAGTEAVGELGVARIADGVRLTNRSWQTVGEDLLIAADVSSDRRAPEPPG